MDSHNRHNLPKARNAPGLPQPIASLATSVTPQMTFSCAVESMTRRYGTSFARQAAGNKSLVARLMEARIIPTTDTAACGKISTHVLVRRSPNRKSLYLFKIGKMVPITYSMTRSYMQKSFGSVEEAIQAPKQRHRAKATASGRKLDSMRWSTDQCWTLYYR